MIDGGSPNGVWRALTRLERSGVIHADRRGRATYYEANRDHLAWPAIEALTQLRGELFRRIGRETETWAVQPIHGSVFGSVARGDADAASDIDLLFVRPGGLDEQGAEEWEQQLDALREDVARWTGNRVQTYTVDGARLGELVGSDDPLVGEWLADEVRFAGRPLRDVVAEAS